MFKNATHAIVKFDCILVFSLDGCVRLENTLDAELTIYNAVIERIAPLVKGKKTADLERIETEKAIQQTGAGIVYSLSAAYDHRIALYRKGDFHSLA